MWKIVLFLLFTLIIMPIDMFYSVVATGIWINWSIGGALLLVLLFKGSSDFSGGVSAEKYPMYKKYIEQVGMFLPIKGRFKG